MCPLLEIAIKCENTSAERENLWWCCFNDHLSALKRWGAQRCEISFSSLKSDWMSFSMLLFMPQKIFHLSTASFSLPSRESLFLPGLLRIRANELNSSIQLWKHLISFHRRKSPILSLYLFYVLNTVHVTHIHIHTTKIRQCPVQWWTINILCGSYVRHLSFCPIHMT